MSNEFFQEQREQSLIKTRIVLKYFSAWTKIMLSTQKRHPIRMQKLAYVDLFAGPGQYVDEKKSTPLLVLEMVIANPELANCVITLFNDKDASNVRNLKELASRLAGIETLKYPPVFHNDEIGTEIAAMFSRIRMVPTFFFVDPWGYKGLSLDLISAIIKDWGCECVFFFNYNRISSGINNDAVISHMALLFGDEQLNLIRQECIGKLPREREVIIVQSLCDALRNSGSKYVLPFRFKNDRGTRTSHHLIFLSKNFKGYEIMKEIMHKESTDSIESIASFEYNPGDIHFKQGSLLDMLSRPLDNLKDMLLQEYAGRTIDFYKLYKEHNVDKPYIKKNYKDAFKVLLENGEITAINPKTGKPPRKGTFSDNMQITFGG